MVEQFTLRWNKFHSNVSQGFVSLLEREELVDVTLVAEGQLLRAHKLVLSLCSPYFKKLFAAHPHEHPVVILKDVTLAELRDILHFIYRGEVNICQQDLSSFLHTAELLQVRGLSEHPPDLPSFDELVDPPEAEAEAPVADDDEPIPAPRLNHSASGGRGKPAAKKRKIKTEETPPPEPVRPRTDSCDSRSDSDRAPDDDPDALSAEFEPKDSDDAKKGGGGGGGGGGGVGVVVVAAAATACQKNRKVGNYQCIICHRPFTSRYNLKIHMRDKHYFNEDTLQCHICNKRMRNPSCLRVHLYHHRKQQAANVSTDASPDVKRDIKRSPSP